MESSMLRWIPLLPLAGAIVNGLGGLFYRKLPRRLVETLAVAMPLCSFAIAAGMFRRLLALPEGERLFHDGLYLWFSSGSLSVPLAFQLDELTAVMVLVVTGVGSLIHIYSVGYMADDRSPARYFSYLNLFTFAMLVLVMADNILLMFVGWEGVGVCSYLLIGFWYEDMDKAIAGKKAFITNRVGDFGFILGVFVLFWTLATHGEPTVTFRGMEAQTHLLAEARFLGLPVATVAGVLLFVGAMGKSAQFPLHVWLPDAMAGPTPVSALIHAATMVTAGVYMVARMGFLYALSPTAQTVVAGVGAFTALFAASIGLFQNDIKKVLAYSTVSQLGFMFIGVGVGAFSAGIFHLVTHAFFKALLFLGAGSVILGMHHEQDIRKMGGLYGYMKVTAVTFVVGWLAIIGVPGLSGFFSKDEILWSALSSGHPIVWLFGAAAAVLTAFYMTRLVWLTFFGKLRLSEAEMHHLPAGKPVESPPAMWVPLAVLALLSAVAGFVGVPDFLGGSNRFHHFLGPVFGAGAHEAGAAEADAHPFIGEWGALGVAVVAMLLGAGAAYHLYSKRLAEAAERVRAYTEGAEKGSLAAGLYRLIAGKYYVDEFYDRTIIRAVREGSRDILWPFDKRVIDGVVNGIGEVTKAGAAILSFLQNGNVKRYLAGMALGLAMAIVLLVYVAQALRVGG